MSVKAQAFSAVRWTSFVTVARIVLQTLQLIVLARLVTPQDFGLMAMIISVTAFIQLFADLGVSNSIIHARNISQPVLSTLYWLNVLVGGILSLCIWLASPWIAGFYTDPKLATPLALTGLSFFLLALGQQVKVLAEKRLAFRPIALVELVSAVVSTALTIAAAFWGAGVYALVIGVLALAGGNSLLYLIFARDDWRPSLTIKIREAAPHLRAGMFLLGTSLANTATLQADIIIIGRLLGSNLLGFYTVPRELCLKVMLATNPIITRVGTPLMAQAQNDRELLKRIYLSTIRMTSSINFPIYGAIAVFRHEITQVVFGAQWADSADLLGIMAVWGMFRSLGNPVGSLLYGTGNARLAFVQSLFVAILIVPTIVIGARWGTEGAATALTVFYLVFSFVLWYFVIKPITGATLWTYTEQWATPFLIVLVSCCLAFVFKNFVDSVWLRLPFGLFIGSISYIGLSYVYNAKWIRSLTALIRRQNEGT